MKQICRYSLKFFSHRRCWIVTILLAAVCLGTCIFAHMLFVNTDSSLAQVPKTAQSIFDPTYMNPILTSPESIVTGKIKKGATKQAKTIATSMGKLSKKIKKKVAEKKAYAAWHFESVSSTLSKKDGISTYTQDGNAILSYDKDSLTALDNTVVSPQNSRSFKQTKKYSAAKHKLVHKSGTLDANFSTLLSLPLSYGESLSMGNPQSIAVSADGSTAYVAYPESKSYKKPGMGRIVKYDLDKLASYGLTNGNLSKFAWHVHKKKSAYSSCITVGPRIKMGHGQNLALNPKTGELWFSSEPMHATTNLTRVDTDTLDVDRIITFHTGSTAMGNCLCFDEEGCFWYCKYCAGTFGSLPRGAIRLYRGRISHDETAVRIKLMDIAITHAAGATLQGIAYSTKSKCLYIVNDSALLRIKRTAVEDKTLEAKDVKDECLYPVREFEGLAFDKKGQGYLLVIKRAELFVSDDSGM